mmetsp:Transcript_36366/g.120436  ORF Transcript_36366/g.120436 Transcript_36366/m.120436 type:complete len:306 (-) Transcript_36366:14-931(-)
MPLAYPLPTCGAPRCCRRSTHSLGSWRRRRPPQPAPLPTVAIVVPFRQQKEQDRAAQLAAFLEHMRSFLCGGGGGGGEGEGVRFVVVVAEQSSDGRKFNRGQLLNAGYREAASCARGELRSIILHDVDLLPSEGLFRWYASPPARHAPVHLAAAGCWQKYTLPGYDFFGGVTALHPSGFEASNGFPNDYWGWGMEDDQLRLRIRASGGAAGGVVRPTESDGRYRDLDSVAVLRDVLCSAESAARGLHLINERFLAPSRVLGLDDEWRDANGLRGLRATVVRRSERRLGPAGAASPRLVHVVVELG